MLTNLLLDLRSGRVPGGSAHALISGDDVVCAEMTKVVPGIEVAEVKVALSRTGGRIIPPARAQRIIREAAQRAVERVSSDEIQPPDLITPFAMAVELRQPLSDAAPSRSPTTTSSPSWAIAR